MLRQETLGRVRRVVALAAVGGLFIAVADSNSAGAQSAPAVSAVSPTSGPVTGGTTVIIRGSSFTGATAVDVGATSAPFVVISDTSIKATTPAEPVGTVDVTVTTPDGTSATSGADQFTFTPPTVTAVRPTSGPVTGGTTVTVRGSGFTGATAVEFGSTSAPFVVVSDTSIKATTPAEPVGAVDVTVTTPDGSSATSGADQFTFTPPTVTAVRPHSGPATGGTSVVITGSGFTGATIVDFGTTSASFVVTSDTSITATTPEESVGMVDVRVTTPDGTSDVGGADEFTFTAVTVTGVNPRSGPETGGSVIAITGIGLAAVTAVTFGPTPASTFTIHSDTSITATAPAELPGKVDITVSTPSGTSGTRAVEKFTYLVVPTVVSAVSPTSGATKGGTTVTIVGKNLGGTTTVYFGTAPASSFRINSDTSITAVSPPEAAGKIDVWVTGPGGTSIKKKEDRFTFVAPAPLPPTVSAIRPDSGPTTGGTTVTLTGTNFTGVTSVRFGTVAASSFTVDSATSISAVTADGMAGTVNVTVTTPGGTSPTNSVDHFTFVVPPPSVTGISPTSGPSTGGTKLTISGVNLKGATAVDFGTEPASSFTVRSNSSVTAVAPASAPAEVDVTVTTGGGRSATGAADRFTFLPPRPTVTTLTPDSGPTTGGTVVIITGTGFSGASSVEFATVSAAFVVKSNTSITATTPAEPKGKVDVIVVTAGGASAGGSADRFSFTTPAATVVRIGHAAGHGLGDVAPPRVPALWRT